MAKNLWPTSTVLGWVTPYSGQPIYTSTLGHNAKAFANICQLYFAPNSRIVDLTYGAGAFWKLAKDFPLIQTYCDIQARPGVHLVCDATQTPFTEATFDAAVLDPPYRRDTRVSRGVGVDCTAHDLATRYGLDHVDPRPWRGILHMYEGMIQEAKRIVKPGGHVVVKGMDDATSWFIRDLPTCGMKIIDVHVVTTTSRPLMRHKFQLHARKNHSYFVILRKGMRS